MFDNIKYPNTTTIVVKDVIKQLNSLWKYDYGNMRVGRTILELVTGGWSENEEIIKELEETWFWFFYWEESRRGGYYKFILPKGWKNGKK